MAENQNQPGKYDAVLGGQSPPPVTGVVLGGIEGVEQRLSNPVADVKIAALVDALNYGDAGLELVIQALHEDKRIIQRSAYKLLRRREEAKVKQTLEQYQPWDLFERLRGYQGNNTLHSEQFANRQVVDYEMEVGIQDPAIAYALRCDYYYGDRPSVREQLTSISEDSQASKLEALVFGTWLDDMAGGSDDNYRYCAVSE